MVPSGVTERKVVPLDKPDMVTVDVLNVTEAGLLCYMLTANNTVTSCAVRFAFLRSEQSFCFYWDFFLVVWLKGTWLLTAVCFYLLTAAGCDPDRRIQMISRYVIFTRKTRKTRKTHCCFYSQINRHIFTEFGKH